MSTTDAAAQGQVRLTGVRQVVVIVQDVERAKAFYRDTLELPHLFDIPSAAFFDCGGLRLMLGTAETPEHDHPSSILYYLCDDIHATWAALMARGVRGEREPHFLARMPDHDLWMAFFRDTEDNILALMSEVPRAEATGATGG